jgi:hypothetical protein
MQERSGQVVFFIRFMERYEVVQCTEYLWFLTVAQKHMQPDTTHYPTTTSNFQQLMQTLGHIKQLSKTTKRFSKVVVASGLATTR